MLVVSATACFHPECQIKNAIIIPPFLKVGKNTYVMTSLKGISCPIRVRQRFESPHGPIQFATSESTCFSLSKMSEDICGKGRSIL